MFRSNHKFNIHWTIKQVTFELLHHLRVHLSPAPCLVTGMITRLINEMAIRMTLERMVRHSQEFFDYHEIYSQRELSFDRTYMHHQLWPGEMCRRRERERRCACLFHNEAIRLQHYRSYTRTVRCGSNLSVDSGVHTYC